MPLSLAIVKGRMDRDASLALLGDFTDAQDDIIGDAVNEFIRFMDRPITSGAMAVTAGSTGPYAVPTGIGKIRDVRDADGDSVVYTYDDVVDKITLQDAPGETGNYTVYGLYEDAYSDLDSCIALINTDLYSVLYSFVRWAAYDWDNHDNANSMYQKARDMARNARKKRNRDLDKQTMQALRKDVQGRNIGDSASADGIDVQINNLYESDLFNG